ncbi:putative UPF0481 protein At3g02645 [Aegilops tauschii subsp. strangulata]|uniref:Uncharacterized protein n=2 Tax=Aegilops tauschii TaxID=37682 RepID=A0A453SZH0_AEGTS|nr:putative UPF0481 protein At3g02645 [Aegilops tauschii subsp. strangulata]
MADEVVEVEMAESRSSNRGAKAKAKAMAMEEEPWVKLIRESLTVEEEEDVDTRVSVFDVPKQLQVHKPEAYCPQFIGLGPYHHRHPELYGMERYKIDAARRALKRLLCAAAGPSHDVLDELVNELMGHDLKVRAHYHRYLELSREALSLMMIMDGAFLLEFLTIHHHTAAEGEREGEGASSSWTKRMEHLVDLGGSGTGRKSAHGLILRDMLMLENQIPLFVLAMIKAKCSSVSVDEASRRLTLMVTELMRELCPFKMEGHFPETSCDVTKHAHLLELLYHLVVPVVPTPTDTTENAHTTPPFSGHIVEMPEPEGGGQGQEKPSACTGNEHAMMQLFEFIALKLKGGRLGKVMKPIELVVKAPWNKLAGIPGVESFMSADASQQEITIPSVSELVSSGVKFKPTSGDLSTASTIAFDRKTATLRLPVVTLDGNTEVVLRNLVAYESSAASGPLVLTRYTELMNGIIDTDDDVALLRKRGVVLNHMKKRDGEAAKLWNGMSRSVQHSRVPALDKVIEEVNRYYDGRWSVKTKRFMRKYVLSSWKMLTFLATISMLLLTTVQAFCSVYTCSRWWFGDLVAVVPSDSE